jgi:intraflagellar transport protein 122
LRIPAAWQSQVDLACVVTRSKPFSDAEDLLPLCFRCSTTNPLVSGKGDVCISCGGRFVRSFVTFEHLPTVEFEVADGISASEARKLINEDPPASRGGGGGGGGRAPSRSSRQSNGDDGFHERDMGGDVQTLMFDDAPGGGGGGAEDDVMLRMDDPFTQQMAVPNAPIVCNREMLRNLPPAEVVVKPSGCALVKPRYFRLMDAECPVTVDEAGNFYETDEYELACLERTRTPFTRKAVTKDSEQASAPPSELPETPKTQEKTKGGWGQARAMNMVRGMEMGGSKEYDPSSDRAGGPRQL